MTHVLESVQGPFEEAPNIFEKGWVKTVETRFDDVISSLRLFKRGHVAYEFIEPRIAQQKVDVMSGAELHDGSGEGLGFGVMPYEISADLSKFLGFWKTFSRAEHPAYLKQAIKRLNIGLEESDLEDRLLDYIAGLEAVFLRDDRELGYKLKMRAAAFLGKGGSKKVVADKIGEAYEVRGAISHGTDWRGRISEGTEKALNRLDDVIETYLRYSIRGCLELETEAEGFKPEYLDNMCLEADGSQSFSNLVRDSIDITICQFCRGAIGSERDYCDVCGRRQAAK
jgi:hypothetical protein